MSPTLLHKSLLQWKGQNLFALQINIVQLKFNWNIHPLQNNPIIPNHQKSDFCFVPESPIVSQLLPIHPYMHLNKTSSEQNAMESNIVKMDPNPIDPNLCPIKEITNNSASKSCKQKKWPDL